MSCELPGSEVQGYSLKFVLERSRKSALCQVTFELIPSSLGAWLARACVHVSKAVNNPIDSTADGNDLASRVCTSGP